MSITCPTCKGAGESLAFINTGSDSSKHRQDIVKCFRCNGSGCVHENMPEWQRRGAEFRDARMSEGLVMHQVADRVGMAISAVSKAYNGYIDPSQLIDAWKACVNTGGAA